MPAHLGLRSPAVGIGFRSELAADLLRRHDVVDFVEVVAEACWSSERVRREVRAVGELWPVVPHGVKLSLGSAEGIDPERAAQLGKLARELRAPLVSEHVAFVRAGDREIGHLTALPLTRTALDVVTRNVATTRRHLPDVPFLLENVARSVRWDDDALDEGAFHAELAARTGCGLLLDVSNLYANALNAGLDPLAELGRFPLERVGMLHVAGGVFDEDFYFDDHAHAVPEAVFELCAAVLAAVPNVPMLIERDADFPPFAELEGEVRRLRSLPERPAPRRTAALRVVRAADGALAPRALEAAQAELARLLTTIDQEASPDFDELDLERTRLILHSKRVGEALPLLPRLGVSWERIQAFAASVVRSEPRHPRLTAVSDAWHIATRALSEPQFADDARLDELTLRCRFVRMPDGAVAPRRGPFVEQVKTVRGVSLWAFKGPGAKARARFIERRVGG